LQSWPIEKGMQLFTIGLFRDFLNKGLRESFDQNKDFIIAKSKPNTRTNPIGKILKAIQKEFIEKAPGYQVFIRALLYRFFHLLFKENYYETTYVDLGNNNDYALAYAIKQYLEKNRRKLTTHEVSARMNYSENYLNRVFKKHFGYTVNAYNKVVCLRQAAHLLASTKTTIQKIISDIGFASRAHFYKAFYDEYECTPLEYRNQQKIAAIKTLFDTSTHTQNM
jgi:AraC-like DNA-binding protein